MAFQWNSMAPRWNAVEFHGIQKIAIVYMVYMLFQWHFSGIIWHPGGMLWNAMEFHGIQKNFNSGNPWNLGL